MRDARPAAGAQVTLRSSLTAAGLARERTVRTDAEGRFSFGTLPPAQYTVAASQPGRVSDRVEVDLGRAHADPPPDRLQLYLGQCEAIVHGVVSDAWGGPIRGARLGANHIGQLPVIGAETDEHGAYTLCVAAGVGGLSVIASGYGIVERVVVALGTRRLDISLSPAAVIEGTVVDPSGAGVARAAVRLQGRTDESERLGTLYSVSDDQGHFRLEASPGEGFLRAYHAEGSSILHTVELHAGEIVQGLVLRLQPRAPIRGQVRMEGKPAAGIELELWSKQGFASTASDHDGNFAVEAGPIGQVEVTSPTHRVTSGAAVTVPATGIDHLRVEVAPLARVTGRIERGGVPAVAARIRLRGAGTVKSARADQQGVFRIADLPAATYQLEVADDGARAKAIPTMIELGDGEDRDLGTIQLTVTGRIAGRVIDEHGLPIAACFVSVGPIGEATEASTDEAGRFELKAVELGAFPIQVRLRGSVLEQLAGPSSIELTARQPDIQDLTLRVRRPHARLAGRVVSATGAPMSDVTIQVRPDSSQRSWGFVAPSAVTGQDGRFTIDDLASGASTIRAAQRGGGAVVLTGIEVPRDHLEVVLAANGAIEGSLAKFAQPPQVFVTSSVDQRVRLATVDGDRFSLRNVPVGDYVVIARGDDSIGTAAVHVAPPGVARVVVEARASRRLAGVVRELSAKAPASGLVCGAAPRSAPAARLWFAAAPTGADGRFEISVGADEVLVQCDGGAAFVNAARAAPGAVVDLWTLRRPAKALPALGVTLDRDPLVLRVTAVAAGSIAERAGVAPGDTLVAIGEQSVEALGAEVAAELWKQRAAQGPIALAVQRAGKAVTLPPAR